MIENNNLTSLVLTELSHDKELSLEKIQSLDDFATINLLESLPQENRLEVWKLIANERYLPLLTLMQVNTAENIVQNLEQDVLITMLEASSFEQFSKIVEIFPKKLVDSYIGGQSEEISVLFQEIINYEENEVGRYLSKQFITCRTKTPLSVLREKYNDYASCESIIVLDSTKQVIGAIALKDLFNSSDAQFAGQVKVDTVMFDHMASLQECSRKINPSDKVSWFPIIRERMLLGVVSTNTILWSLQEDINKAATKSTPSAEEDLFTPIGQSSKRRAIWLIINLLTAFLAAAVISIFEEVVQKVVVLAILMPVVASMGGIAGSQTLAIAVRGLALKHLSSANIKLLLIKELKIALINGLSLGVLIGLVCGFWFDMMSVGIIICVAIVCNSLTAACSGTLIPFALTRMKVDPAIAGSVILTTATDVVGFFVFLGLASLVYMNM